MSDARKAQLKELFLAKRGYWNPFWDGLLDLDPAFFAAYLGFSSVPWESGSLSPKVKELVYTAIDAATTHLYEPGLRQHITNALGYGATSAEVMQVYKIASLQGIHTCNVGVPILVEELQTAGVPARPTGADTRRAALKAEFENTMGYWSPQWDGLLDLDPDFFAAFLALAKAAHQNGPLEPKVQELIHIAVDSSTTHLYEPALRLHIRRALELGATKEEIMEVFELTSVLGIHTCTLGVPVLLETLAVTSADER